jgi:hypothetical protein
MDTSWQKRGVVKQGSGIRDQGSGIRKIITATEANHNYVISTEAAQLYRAAQWRDPCISLLLLSLLALLFDIAISS